MKYKYKIIKKGRKWYHAEQDGTGYKAQIAINEHSQDWKVGEIVEFMGTLHTTKSGMYKKVFIYPATEEDVLNEEVEKWLRYVEAKTNYVYTKGVNKLKECTLTPEQQTRLDNAINKVTINKCYKKINDHLTYIKINLNKYWYKNGEETIKENLNTLNELGIDTSDYLNELNELREQFENISVEVEAEKEQKAKEDAARYFEIRDISSCKEDTYDRGIIVKNHDGRIGKIIHTWKYYEADTMSIGFYWVDGSWLKCAKCDTNIEEKEKEKFLQKEKELQEQIEKDKLEKQAKAKIVNARDDLVRYIFDNGILAEKNTTVKGKIIFDDFNIYGGGRQLITDNNKIWAIKNNGMDGDNWDLNNVITGGAGAIGMYMIIDDKCKELIAIMGG